MERLLALFAAASLAIGGCVTVSEPTSGRQTVVCVQCGKVRETDGKSVNAPDCHGQRMLPQ